MKSFKYIFALNYKIGGNKALGMIPLITEKSIEKYFKKYQAHLDGPLCIGSNQQQLISIGVDDMVFRHSFNDNSDQTIAIESKYSTEEYTSVLLTESNLNFLGTASGKVFSITGIDFSDLSMIHRCPSQVISIQYLVYPNYIAITCKQQVVILNKANKEIEKIQDIHDGHITSLQIFDNLICTFGADMHLNVSSFNIFQDEDRQQLSLTFLKGLKISRLSFQQVQLTKVKPQCCLVNQKGVKKLLIPGMNDLQQLKFKQEQSLEIQYGFRSPIRHSQQIMSVKTLNQQFIFIVNRQDSAIWNIKKSQIVANFDIIFHNSLITNFGLLGINNSGNIFQFNRPDLIECIQSQGKQLVHEENDQNVNHQNIDSQKNLQKKKKKKRQISKAAKIINEYPQFNLETCYEEYMSARFVFYNEIGCVVERIENQNSVFELSYHNKSKLSKIKFCSQNKSICHFALSSQSFVYASRKRMWFQNQKQVRQGYKWDTKIDGILGVVLSGDWVAAISAQQISVFDFAGNLLHLVCVDRPYMTMAAFEDRLVVVYHASVPLYGSQMFGMKIFQVTRTKITEERQTHLPIEPLSLLKWVGFSAQGMIFAQDTNESIRIYDYSMDSWFKVLSLNPDKQRIFIQNIQNYSIYGFRIQQKSGEPGQPTVMPESIPRKIVLDSIVSETKQLPYLNRLIFRKIVIKHEDLRNLWWRKYKYSRSKGHPNFNYSKSILAIEEIRQMKKNFSQVLAKQLQRYVKSGQFNKKDEDQKAREMDMLMGQYEYLYFDDTFQEKDDLSALLGGMNINEAVKQCLFRQETIQPAYLRRIDELMNLEQQKVSLTSLAQTQMMLQ